MQKRLFLGIDTSAYTTSLVVLDENQQILFQEKKVLLVPEGKRGLRQQEALFQHIQNLPCLIEAAAPTLRRGQVKGIAVSAKPRDTLDSYMPVFEAGIAFAKSLAAIYEAPIHLISHQMNHLYAADFFERIAPKPCLVFHLSGGTTEILDLSHWSEGGASLIGGTKDISFGQLIDRIGVSLRGEFPAGPWLDQMALEGTPKKTRNRIHRVEDWWNLSGIETWFQNQMIGQESTETIAATLFSHIAESLAEMIRYEAEKTNRQTVILVGGVAESRAIRETLSSQLVDLNLALIFVRGTYSADHALGCAWYAWRKWNESVTG